MKLIVGLGNPGEKYARTRHNLGFVVVENFLKDFETVEKTAWEDTKKFKSEIAQIEWQPRHGSLEKVILVKPQSYMNNSGLAVGLLTTYYKIQATDLWVIHDDIDLPLGYMKIRFGGASAGHHGVESIMEHLKTDKFWRFRMGTGQKKTKGEMANYQMKNVEDYVLGNFAGKERGKLKDLIKRGVKAIETALEDGLDSAMNRFNTK